MLLDSSRFYTGEPPSAPTAHHDKNEFEESYSPIYKYDKRKAYKGELNSMVDTQEKLKSASRESDSLDVKDDQVRKPQAIFTSPGR